MTNIRNSFESVYDNKMDRVKFESDAKDEQSNHSNDIKINLGESGLKLKKQNYSIKYNSFYSDIMKYPIILMKIFGIHHDKRGSLIQKIYCVIVLVILWLNSIKTLSSFEIFYGKNSKFTANFVSKTGFFISSLTSALNITILYLNNDITRRENKFINELNDLFEYNSKNLNKKIKTLKNRINIIFLTAFLIATLNTIACFISFFFYEHFLSAFSALLLPFNESISNNLFYRLVMAFIGGYSSFSWSLSIAYFASHCRIITFHLNYYNKEFKTFIKNNIVTSKYSESKNECHSEVDYFKELNQAPEDNFEHFR